MTSPAASQAADRLTAELRNVRRIGLARLRPEEQAPILLMAATSSRTDGRSVASKTAVRDFLRDQITRLPDNLSVRTLLCLFGLNSDQRATNPTDLLAQAAAIWGVEPTPFRRQPLQGLLSELADKIIGGLTATPEQILAVPPIAESSSHATKRKAPPTLKIEIGMTFDGSANYTVCNPDGTDRRPRRGETLHVGGGGAGTVYCARFKEAQLRAVKFLTANYLDEDRTGQHAADFTASFGREIDILYKLSHGNIARLHDAGKYLDGEAEWPYLVTEFIAGPMLKNALEDPQLGGDEIYRIFREIIDAVRYLHRNDVYHSDIKHENIKMRRVGEGTSDAVLLDLGAAHWLGEEPNSPAQRALDDADAVRRFRFVSTRRITHERFKPHIGGGRLSKDDLQTIMPPHDLYCLGILLSEMLGLEALTGPSPRERLRRVIGDSGILVLDEIVSDLLNAPESRSARGYNSIEEVAEDWEKLHPNYLSPAGTPELSLAAEFKFSILTATGRTVFTPRLSQVMNHKLMQRLRDIPQLEYTALKFVGASHTRLSHSTAVLRNSRYYLAHLLNEAKFRRMVEPADLQATLLLALLHDIGHFQLSHMFEDFAADQRTARDSDIWKTAPFDIPTDDDLFMAIVANGDPDVTPVLRGGYEQQISDARERSTDELGLGTWGPPNRKDEYRPLRDVIQDGFARTTYAALVDLHQTVYVKPDSTEINPAHLVLGAVISSDIDADKTAYLVEDSQRTGVPYGGGVDLDGILGNLCVPSAEDLQGTTNPVLGILRTGVTAAQSVAINRNAMLTAVYWNRSNRSASAMIKFVISRLLQAGALSLPDYIGKTFFGDREHAMSYLFELYRKTFPEREIVPIAGLMQGERRLYKPIFQTADLAGGRAEEYSEALLKKRYAEIIAVEDQLCAELAKEPSLTGLRSGEVVVDVPSKERERVSGDRGGSVFVYARRPAVGGGSLLTEATPIMQQLKQQHRSLNRICRVFIAPERLSDERTMHRAQEIARAVITSSIGA